MGLREQNAARTRAAVVEGAMALFLERGYDATTMEDVARHVDVSVSTLYRYFATKEALAIAPIGEPGLMAHEIESRPEGEDVSRSLGHALLSLLEAPRSDVVADERWLGLIRRTPRLSVQLLEWYSVERALLASALGRRLGLAATDARVVLSASVATSILEMVTDESHPDRAGSTPGQHARRLLQKLDVSSVVVPTLPGD